MNHLYIHNCPVCQSKIDRDPIVVPEIDPQPDPARPKRRTLRNARGAVCPFRRLSAGLTRPRGRKDGEHSNVARKPERENATTPSGGGTTTLIRRPGPSKTSL